MSIFARYGATPDLVDLHDDTRITPQWQAAIVAAAQAQHRRTLSWAERGLAALQSDTGTAQWRPYLVDATGTDGRPQVQIAFRCTIGVSDRATGCTMQASEPNRPGGTLSPETRRRYRAIAEAKAHAVLAPLEQGRVIFVPEAGLNGRGEFVLAVIDPG